ncbi:hypothetical protein CBL_09249 [Carabus blaptoides fortunei]
MFPHRSSPPECGTRGRVWKDSNLGHSKCINVFDPNAIWTMSHVAMPTGAPGLQVPISREMKRTQHTVKEEESRGYKDDGNDLAKRDIRPCIHTYDINPSIHAALPFQNRETTSQRLSNIATKNHMNSTQSLCMNRAIKNLSLSFKISLLHVPVSQYAGVSFLSCFARDQLDYALCT